MTDPQFCAPKDIDSWLELARDVRHVFGPMPDLLAHIQRGISRRTAMVTLRSGSVVGAMLLSGPGKPQTIRWLAVHPNYRGQGVGTALLRSAIRHWPEGDIAVVTFPANHRGGQAARRLYKRNGFASQGLTDPAPDGSPRELFLLTRAGT
ncbi:MAG TPA: GNAT family N-acetyltransferase [Candidatus Microbacterium pullistercoris]|nr:GNAT family N-acetyltransferase [Candidatus Microbacterium pullistercoris]